MLSVIIPVYNAEKYISSCLESLLAYSGEELEVLVVDDGSKDGSGQICDEYAARDERVKVFHQANQGVSAARNLGLEHARGEWISFVDADDEVLPGYVEACLNRENPADVAYFAHEGYNLKSGYYTERPEIEECLLGLKCHEQGFEFYGYTWNKFFKASIIREHVLRFPLELNHREDEVFTTEFLHHAQTLEVLDGALYHYRIDNNGVHLTQKQLSSHTLFLLASAIERQLPYWSLPAMHRYEVYRALYIYCDALLHTHLFKMFGIVSKITGFVKSYNREIDPQQYPGRFVKYATSRVLLLLWGVKRKIEQ